MTEEELVAIEESAGSTVARPFRAAVLALITQLRALWPGDDAPEEAKAYAVAQLNLDSLSFLVPGMEEALDTFITQGLEAGIEMAVAEASAGGVDVDTPFKQQSAEEAPDLRTPVREQLAKARTLLTQVSTLNEGITGLAVALHAGDRVEAAARWHVNSAAAEGAEEVAEQDESLVLVWVPERDACVHCAAYAGEINSGRGYRGGLTFGKKPLSKKRVPKPPLHPNCRCRQRVWSPQWRSGDVALPETLRREAERSILRGWSVPSESNSVRLAAAQKLLSQGTDLPKSVKDYARKAITRGEFQRGRSFPS